MKRWRIWLLAILLLGTILPATPTAAADTSPKNKGLFIAPLREYVTVKPNGTVPRALTVANYTSSPMLVTLSTEQFSVADFTYDYTFSSAKGNWVTFSTPQLTLQPGKSQTVTYQVHPPADATPGGHYFTLFATAIFQNGSIASSVRAATILYTTVTGNLTYSSQIIHEQVPRVSFGQDIGFSLDVRDTGNTHFFTYTSGQLHGLSAKGSSPEVTHLLLPGAARTVASTVSAPLLPGIYTLSYGFKTNVGQQVTRIRHIIYVPPWALALPIGIAWIGWLIIKRRRRATGP